MWTDLLSGTLPRWAPTPSESDSTFPSETVQYAKAGTLTHECTQPPEAPEPRWKRPGLLPRGPAASGAAPSCPAPRPGPGARTHLQHELTLVAPHEDELSGQPVASATAAHQEPGGDAHLGTGEACPALGRRRRQSRAPPPGPPDTPKASTDPAPVRFKHLHGTTAAAASRNAGLRASPSPSVPVPCGPLPG